MVRGALRRAHRTAGARLAGDPLGRRHPRLRTYRIGQDAGGVSGVHRPARAQGDRGRARRSHRGRLRLAAQGPRQRHPQEPRDAARRNSRARAIAGRRDARGARRRPDRRHAGGRASQAAPAPAAHPGHDTRVALHPADGGKSRETLRSVRTVIVDEIHAVADDKRGAHLALSLERLDALADARPQRIGLSATQRPIELVADFLGGAGRPRPAIVPDRPPARRRPRDRDAAGRARSRRDARAVGRHLRPDRRARRRASIDAGVREHAPHGRAARAQPRERRRRGRRRHASRQPVAQDPARRRAAPEGRRNPGARRHGVARARHRHRRRRPRMPDRIAARRSRSRGSGSAAPATGAARFRRAGCFRRRATSWWSARRSCGRCGPAISIG